MSSSYFSIQTSEGTGNQVRVSVRDPSTDWMYGRAFEIRIQVHKREDYTFGSSNIVSNQASLAVDQNSPKKSKTVRTSFYYQITTEAENGSITASNLKVPAGGSMRISYAPLTGYYLKSITSGSKSD